MTNPIHMLSETEVCTECKGTGCHYCNNRGNFPSGWYFWDETWTNRMGPYLTKEQASETLREYCNYMLGSFEN